MMLPEILSDGFFAAVAAIGFGAISDPPMRAFPVIALLAAVGHALRFVLMQGGVDIATASLCASVVIGVDSLLLGGRIRCPMTVLFIPALLPMIPGMYAYKTVFATIISVHDSPMAMQIISIRADARRAMPFSTCPSTMSITPLMSGTPGMRKRTLVARATSEVVSNISATEAYIEAANDEAMKMT